ncbi:MAG: hypothetical protein IKG22_01725 [Atopobiaceae bacterium]|nr:hypothetical protein [Atopobiaceae bacterium]
MSQQSAKERARRQLVDAVVELGYPEEFGEVLASELGGEKSMLRMTSYLRQARPTSPEQIADELLTILSERRRWVEQKMSERANASVTAFYNRPRDD